MPEIAGQWGDKQLTSQDQDGGWDVAKFAKTLMLHGWRNEQLGSLHSKREKTLDTGLAWPGSPGWPVLPGPRVASLPKNRPVLTMGCTAENMCCCSLDCFRSIGNYYQLAVRFLESDQIEENVTGNLQKFIPQHHQGTSGMHL